MFLTGVWHLNLDLDIITDLWYKNVPNFGSLSWNWKYNENQCPLIPCHLIPGSLEDDGGSWCVYGIFILIQMNLLFVFINLCSEFCLFNSILIVQITCISFKFLFGLRYTHDPNFGCLSWFKGCTENHCPLNPYFELLSMLDVPPD